MKPVNEVKLGILGAGQLGKMLAIAAGYWNVKTFILDQDTSMPAAKFCDQFVRGDFRDYKTVLAFGKKVDVLTLEIEQVNSQALKDLQKKGVQVYPSAELVELIQDKGAQGEFFLESGFPKKTFWLFDDKKAVLTAFTKGVIRIPFVQKTRKAGYDGRGVCVVKSKKDILGLLDGECLVEPFVDIQKEISVIVARNTKGEVACYDPVEMIFDPKANLVDYLVSPACISLAQAKQSCLIAKQVIQKMRLVGVLAVEMFIDKKGKLWINEVAPRPHNSGHQTIEGCITSQYEQHLRAILGLPLGSTQIKIPSVMINLLGEKGYSGLSRYQGLEKVMAIDGAKVHIYGKKETKPYRKMGHVTVVDKNLNSAKKKINTIKKTLKVIS